jgi:hypothetical protein
MSSIDIRISNTNELVRNNNYNSLERMFKSSFHQNAVFLSRQKPNIIHVPTI